MAVRRSPPAFTLVELCLVIAILSALAVFAVTRVGAVGERARIVATEADLRRVAAAWMDPDSGYLADMKTIPGFSLAYLRLANLLVATNLFGEVAGDAGAQRGIRVDDGRWRSRYLAPPREFVAWSEVSRRGWRGPYLKHPAAVFPSAEAVRFAGDASFGARGFFPEVTNLRVPVEIARGEGGCSAYGFPGEPAVNDAWGNPLVLQVPPAQAFEEGVTNVTDETRFRYARLVSAGPNGRLETPCFHLNDTNDWRAADANWQSARFRRLVRQAGLIDGGDRQARGDDLVLFLERNDIDEGGGE